MRAATVAVSIVAIGMYLAVAAAFAFSPTWIGLGMLGIALLGAIAMVVADGSRAEAVR